MRQYCCCLLGTWLALVSACGQRNNPYDEKAPTSLQEPAGIEGVVLDAKSGEPLPGAVVVVEGPRIPGNSPWTTPADGRFRFYDLVAGRYKITATHAAHIRQSFEAHVYPGETRNVEFLLVAVNQENAQSHLTGVAQKSGELALPTQQQDHSGILVEVEATGIRSVTNTMGAFDLFLSPGSYTIVFSATGYVTTRREDVVLVVSENPIDLPDGPVVLAGNPGLVSGQISLESPEIDPPADNSGITVSLQGSEQTTTAADGTYRLTGIAPGTYVLTASKARWNDVTRSNIVVRPGLETAVESLALPASRNTLRGRVDLADNDDDSGVSLNLTGTAFTAISSPSGLFQLNSIPVGSYELTTTKAGYVREVRSVLIESAVATELETITLIARQGDFDINNGVAYTNDAQRQVVLNLNNDSAAHYRASENSTFVDDNWLVYDANPHFILSDGDGQKTVYVWYKDNTDTVSRRFSSSIVLDRLAPTVQSFTINAGAYFTKASIVALAFAVADAGGSGVKEMQIASANDFDNVPFESYKTSTTYPLADGDGSKEVWARFRDHAGNLTPTATMAHIILDTLAPTLSRFDGFQINDGAAYASSPLVELSIFSDDATRMALSNQAGFPVAVYQPCAPPLTTASWYLSPGDGPKTVYLLLQDEAGNVSETAFEASISLDSSAPRSPTIVLSNGADYTNAVAPHTVAVTLTAEGADAYQLSLDGTFTVDAWQSMSSSPLQTTVNLTPSDGTKTVYAVFRDDAGNRSQVVTDSIFLDTTFPTAGTSPLLIDAGAAMCHQRSVTLSFDIDGASEMRIIADETDDNENWVAYADSASVLLFDADCAAGVVDCRSVCATFRDAAGNGIGPFCDPITLDRVAPTIPIIVTLPKVVNADSFDIDIAAASVDNFFSAYQILVAPNDSAFRVLSTQRTDTRFTVSLRQGDASVGGSQANTVRIRAVDQAGNVSAESAVVITEDSVRPRPPQLQEPLPNMLNADTTVVYLDLATSNPQSFDDPNFSHYQLNGGGFGQTRVASPLSDGFVFQLVQGDGSHCRDILNPSNPNLLYVSGVDAAGNVSDQSVVAVCEDSVAPSPPELTPREAVVNADTIRVKLLMASDDNNFGTSRYQLQGGHYFAFTDTDELDYFNFALFPNRSNELCIRGIDQAGNIGATDCVNIVEQSVFKLNEAYEPNSFVSMAGDYVVFVYGNDLKLYDLVDTTMRTIRNSSLTPSNPHIALAIGRTQGEGSVATALPDQLRIVWNENGGHQLWTYTQELHDASQTTGPVRLYVDSAVRNRPKTDGMSIVYADSVSAGSGLTVYTSVRTTRLPYSWSMTELPFTGSQLRTPGAYDIGWDGSSTTVTWSDTRSDAGGDIYRYNQRWRSATATPEAVATGLSQQAWPVSDGKYLSWVQNGDIFSMDNSARPGSGVSLHIAATRIINGYNWHGSVDERSWLLYMRDNGATAIWLSTEIGALGASEITRSNSDDGIGYSGRRWAGRVAWNQASETLLTDLGETKFVIAEPSGQTHPVVSGDIVGWIDGSVADRLRAQFLNVETGALYTVADAKRLLSFGGVYAAFVGDDDVSRIVNIQTGASVAPLPGATAEIRINDQGSYAVWFEPVNVNDVPIFGSVLPAPTAALTLNRTAVTTSTMSRSSLDVAGDVVVWQQNRFSPQVYCLDLSVGSELLVTDTPVNTHHPRVAIDPTNNTRVDVVYDDNLTPSRTLYYCNFVCAGVAPVCGKPKAVSPRANLDSNADIADGIIVWRRAADVNASGDIIMYDPHTGLRRNLTFDADVNSDASAPSVSGNRVVWKDERYGNDDIMMHVFER